MAVLAALPAWRKLELIGQLNDLLTTLTLNGLKGTDRGSGDDELRHRLDELRLGAALAHRLKKARQHRGLQPLGARVMASDPTAVIAEVVGALDRLGVPYYIGGSIAGGIHGVYRATADVDIVADLQAEQTEALARLLGAGFYADAGMMRDAIHHRSSFNLLHLETGFKVDIFIPKHRAFDRSQFARRVSLPFSAAGGSHAFICDVEGTILAKLEWYRAGGEVSERQWTDILGMLKVKGREIDHAYLRHWAAELGLADLLERALDDAGPS